jgi:hypothetical protein
LPCYCCQPFCFSLLCRKRNAVAPPNQQHAPEVRPAGPAATASIATTVIPAAAAAYVLRLQRKSRPSKERPDARQSPRRELSAVGLQNRDLIIAGSTDSMTDAFLLRRVSPARGLAGKDE